jgi:hypothetical protein
VIVTLLGYLVVIDSALNSFGWALDMVAHHTLIDRVVLTAWGNMFDAGYFWHYNELWLGGATAPGEKAWEIALLPIVFCMRLAAAIGFLQMKRWGQQWLIVTCWFGVVIWVGYVANMTIYATSVTRTWCSRRRLVALQHLHITPFLAIPTCTPSTGNLFRLRVERAMTMTNVSDCPSARRQRTPGCTSGCNADSSCA